jgi:hypothetical protein
MKPRAIEVFYPGATPCLVVVSLDDEGFSAHVEGDGEVKGYGPTGAAAVGALADVKGGAFLSSLGEEGMYFLPDAEPSFPSEP